MKVKFWGTRGSISKAGRETLTYGGHTSCVQLTTNDGTHLILDCGTGAHGLGMQLTREGRPVDAHIFITHTHWDHIQGLPFFTPLFIPGNNVHVYGPHGLSGGLRDALRGQMQYQYFPISTEAFGAAVEYHDLAEERFTIGDINVTTRYMNHPAVTLGYRIEADGATVVYCTDHEPHDRALAAGGCPEPLSADDKHCTFMRGADLLIHDCQYTAEEYPQKVGWGHSTLEYVIDMASHAQVRQVALFHHDPLRSDDDVARMAQAGTRRAEERAAQRAEATGSGGAPPSVTVTAATEEHSMWLGECPAQCHGCQGQWLTPEEGDRLAAMEPQAEQATRSRALATRRLPQFSADNDAKMPVLVCVSEPSVRECVLTAVQADSRMLPQFAATVEELEKLLSRKNTAVMILGKTLEGTSQGGLALLNRLRVHYPELVCIIACEDGRKEVGHPEVSDWLQWPFSQHYARTRITAMLLRYESKWVAADRCRDEERRLAELQDLRILDTKPDPRYDAVTNLCRTNFNVAYALISLVDSSRQWFKSKAGNVACSQTSRDESFCSHAILQDDVFEIPDALADARFADNPLVLGELHLRFYAGVPLTVRGGHKVGTLCIADDRPKKLTKDEGETLRQLGRFVSTLIEMDYVKNSARPMFSDVSAKYTPGPSSPPGGSPVSPKPSLLSSLRRAVSAGGSATSSPRTPGSITLSPKGASSPRPNSTVCSIQ